MAVQQLKATLDGENLYGRLTIPGMSAAITTRRRRKANVAETTLLHRTKNGVYDPITYYHLMDALMRLQTGQEFRTAEFLPYLRTMKPQIVWDAPTVGRILSDIADSLYESLQGTAISWAKRWNGMTYVVHDHPEFRAAMFHLLNDLYTLAQRTVQEESDGIFAKRLNSPLQNCPSLG